MSSVSHRRTRIDCRLSEFRIVYGKRDQGEIQRPITAVVKEAAKSVDGVVGIVCRKSRQRKCANTKDLVTRNGGDGK